ncbi:MAG: roadblock/LC7 domain-containing protein [Betaproteobacteria bacterium]|nr:roadblock/LC7 domain-containing protein [Betaproteobacteria bacterium]
MLASILRDLSDSAAGIEGAAVFTTHGTVLASNLPGGVCAESISALTAGVISMGERTTEVFDRGNLELVELRGRGGKVLMTRAGPGALLAVLVEADAETEGIRSDVRRAAAAIAAAI